MVVVLGTVALLTTPRAALAAGECNESGCDMCAGDWICSNDCPIFYASQACGICDVGVDCVEETGPSQVCPGHTYLVRCNFAS